VAKESSSRPFFGVLIIILHPVVIKLSASKVTIGMHVQTMHITLDQMRQNPSKLVLFYQKTCISNMQGLLANTIMVQYLLVLYQVQHSHSASPFDAPGWYKVPHSTVVCHALLWKGRNISSFSSIIVNGQYQEYQQVRPTERWIKTHPNWA